MINTPDHIDRYFDKARRLGFEFGTFDPFSIAEQLNVEVRYVDFDTNPLGSATKIMDDLIILVDTSLQNSNLRYFVVGHELCHIINHTELGDYYLFQRHGKDKLEKEADLFSWSMIVRLYEELFGEPARCLQDVGNAFGLNNTQMNTLL